MPGNLKIDPRDAAAIAHETMITENEIIKCTRVRSGFLPKIKTLLAGLVQTILLRTRMFDKGGTPTFAYKSFINKMKNPPTDYVFESYVLFLARQNQFRIKRPKITYRQRKYGDSHWQRGIKSEVALLKKIIKSSRSWKNIQTT